MSLPVFVLANLVNGVTSIIPDADLKHPGKIAPAPLIRQMQKFGCTEILASPAFIERILQYGIDKNLQLPLINSVFTGGSPVFGSLVSSAAIVFPAAELEIVYGSTEAEPIAHQSVSQISTQDYARTACGSGLLVGTAAGGVQIAVVREGAPLAASLCADSFASLQAPAGQPGEILVTGQHVVKSYVFDASNALTKVRVGDTVWHRTGDSGYIDDQGRLWLLGRSHARIVDDEGTLYPFAVESMARLEAGVEAAALMSTKSAGRTLIVQCQARNRKSITERLSKLAVQFQIKRIVCLDTIPVDRRHNSKTDYQALTKALEKALPEKSSSKQSRKYLPAEERCLLSSSP